MLIQVVLGCDSARIQTRTSLGEDEEDHDRDRDGASSRHVEYGEGEDEEGGGSDGALSCRVLYEGEVDEATVTALTVCVRHCHCCCRHVVITCGGRTKWVRATWQCHH